MQVRAGGESGVAGQADALAGTHALSDADDHAFGLQVRVQRHRPVVVDDPDEVGAAAVLLAVEAGLVEVGFDLHHHAFARGDDRRAFLGGEVERVFVLRIGMAEAAAIALVDAGTALLQRHQVFDVAWTRRWIAGDAIEAQFELAAAAGIGDAQARHQHAAARRYRRARRQWRIADDVVMAGEMQHYLDRAGDGVVGPGQVGAVVVLHAQADHRAGFGADRDHAEVAYFPRVRA